MNLVGYHRRENCCLIDYLSQLNKRSLVTVSNNAITCYLRKIKWLRCLWPQLSWIQIHFMKKKMYLNLRLSHLKITVYSNSVLEIDMTYCWIYEENAYHKVEFLDFLGDEVRY